MLLPLRGGAEEHSFCHQCISPAELDNIDTKYFWSAYYRETLRCLKLMWHPVYMYTRKHINYVGSSLLGSNTTNKNLNFLTNCVSKCFEKAGNALSILNGFPSATISNQKCLANYPFKHFYAYISKTQNQNFNFWSKIAYIFFRKMSGVSKCSEFFIICIFQKPEMQLADLQTR